MDCCICSPMACFYRPPRNTICSSCYEGTKAIISFLNDGEDIDNDRSSVKSHGLLKPNNSAKGMTDVLKQVKEMREREEEMKQRAGFLESFVVAFKDGGIHTDIVLIPGSGAPIHTHRALLAAKSEVFRNMLSSDERYKAPAGDSISLPELSHDGLGHLLAFVYTGTLGDDVTERHLQSLLVAADKYDIPFLRRTCEARLVASLEPRNVLQVLEVAELCSSVVLKERAMNTVVEHAEQVVFSREYHDFAVRNGSLCVDVTRALMAKLRRDQGGRDDKFQGQ